MQVPCTKKTSSTEIELLALEKLFNNLDESMVNNTTIVVLVDSLSALKLILGTDVRNKDLEIFRKIDQHRKNLYERQARDFFIHVRSHRKISVPLNCEADFQAGSIAFAKFAQIPRETTKCKPSECKEGSRCEACSWNTRVNAFLLSLRPSAPPITLRLHN